MQLVARGDEKVEARNQLRRRAPRRSLGQGVIECIRATDKKAIDR